MSHLLVTFELLEPLRKRIAAGMPAYGSCAGMILLASQMLDGRPDQQQLGGLDVVVRRNAFGRQVDSFEADLPFAGVAGRPDPGGVHPGALGGGRGPGRAGAGDGAAADADRHGRGRRGGPRGGGAAGRGAGDVVPPGDHGRPAGARAVLRPGAGDRRRGVATSVRPRHRR